MRNPLNTFLGQQGIMLSVERDGIVIHTLKGLMNHESSTKRAYIGFLPESDVKPDDWLIDPSGQRFYIEDTKVAYLNGSPMQIKAFYFTEVEYDRRKTSESSSVFNIGAIHGQAVVGNQQHFSLTQGVSMQEFLSLIEQKPLDDQDELKELAQAIEQMKELRPNALQRFGKVLAKYSDIAVFAGKMLLAFAVGDNP